MNDRSLTLDLLRIFAALSVMSFHLGNWIWLPDYGDAANLLNRAGGPSAEPSPLLWWGWVGVQVFYTLSGYLIAGVSGNWTGFIAARVKRLVPGAIVCSLLTTLLVSSVVTLNSDWLPKLMASATLWPFGPWVDDVYWTLGMEMGFYAMVAALLAARQIDKLERTMVVLAAVSSVGWLVSMSQGLYAPQLPGLNDRISQLVLLKDAPFFAAGVLLRMGAIGGWTQGRLTALVMIILGGSIIITTEAGVRMFAASIASEALLPAFAWVICIALIATPSRFKSTPSLSLLSRATFPLYLLHNVGGTAVLILAHRNGLDLSTAIPIAAVVSIFLSIAVTSYGEPAILKLARRNPLFQHASKPKITRS